MDHSTEKWTQYFLDKEEIRLLRAIRSNPKITFSGDVIDVDIGIVTGENKYFVLPERVVRDYGLLRYTHRIVSRSAHLKGLAFTEVDWEENVRNGFPAYLFRAPDISVEQQPEAVKKYIEEGEKMGVTKGFKCRIRSRW